MAWSHWSRTGVVAGLAAAVGVGSTVVAPASSAARTDPVSRTLGWRIVYRDLVPKSYSSYRLVAVAGPAEAWAVGGTGVAGPGSPIAAYWHHGKWSASPMPLNLSGELSAVSADSPRDAWAVSSGNVLHWHDGRWTAAKSWSPKSFPGLLATGITAFSPTDVWVFGGSGSLGGLGTWHLRGHKWTRIKGAGRNIYTASALSPSDMWAVGGFDGGAIFHYLSGKWLPITSPALAGLRFHGILASSATSVWVTASVDGHATSTRLLHLDGTTWTSYHIPRPVSLGLPMDGSIGAGLSPDGHDGFWIPTVNYYNRPEWLLHFSSGKWSRVSTGTNTVDVTLILGTRSLWGGGQLNTKTGSDAVIWAYGRIG